MATEAYLKSELAALYNDATYAGRQTALSGLTVPNAGNLPAGASLSGNVISITGAPVDLVGYDLTGLQVIVQSGGDLRMVEENQLSLGIGQSLNNTDGWIRNKLGGRLREIRWNTFDGGSLQNANGVIAGSFEWLHNNRFINIGSDWLKPDGNASGALCLIEGNSVGPFVSFPNNVDWWSSTATYNTNDGVISNASVNGGNTKQYLWTSKNNGNINNPPPTTWTQGSSTDPNWNFVSTHIDGIQTGGDIKGPITVRWNHIAMRPSSRAAFMTAAVWFRPFTTKLIDQLCQAYENWIDCSNLDNNTNFYPRNLYTSDGGNPPTVVPKFFNNWLGRTNYKYMQAASAFEWGGNTSLTETAIPLSDPNIIGSANGTTITPAARASTFPAGGMKALGGGGGGAPPSQQRSPRPFLIWSGMFGNRGCKGC